MIEYALLVMLGFCVAGLLALLIAPTIWRRAVRLTTRRLDATLPMSLSDIEADKDLLRASYAVQIRRLEAGLNKARDKSASQLVEISRLQMVIGEFRDKVAGLEKQLEERSNAAHVFERTIKKRFPELEAALAAAKAALEERAFEIASVTGEMRRKEEALSILQRSSNLQQAEIRKLRETLEGNSADRTGRFKKRPAQWTLEEFRSEYDRLHLEMSWMREQLALAQERESGQVAALRGELQNLAEQIMSAAAAQQKQAAEQRRMAEAAPLPSRESAPTPRRRAAAERPQSAPQPWPGGGGNALPRASETAPKPVAEPARSLADTPPAKPAAPGKSPEPSASSAERSAARPAERRPSITSGAATASSPKPESGALRSLLTRAEAAGPKAAVATAAPAQSAPALAAEPASFAPNAGSAKAVFIDRQVVPGARPTAALTSSVQGEALAAQPRPAAAKAPEPAAPAKSQEPNIDRMLREIFEGGSQAADAGRDAPAQPTAPAEKSAQATAKPGAGETSADATTPDGEADKKQSLLERLRVV